MYVKKQHLKQDMEQLTGSKLGKDYVKTVYCNTVYLIVIESSSCKMLGWINHKMESRLLGENLRYANGITLMAESEEELKRLLMKVKE